MSWKIPDAQPSGPPMTKLPPAGEPRSSIEVDATAVGILRPGDKLVIAVSRLDMAGFDRLRQHLEHNLPGVQAVIVEADSLVIYRGDRDH